MIDLLLLKIVMVESMFDKAKAQTGVLQTKRFGVKGLAGSSSFLKLLQIAQNPEKKCLPFRNFG